MANIKPIKLVNGIPTELAFIDTVPNNNISQEISRGQNILINGGFEIWQRGITGFAGGGVYSADRWLVQGGGITVDRESGVNNFDSGQYSLKAVRSSGASTYIQQKVERYYDYKNKTVSVSVRVKTSVINGCRLQLQDGTQSVYTPYHTGEWKWKTLTASIQVSASSTSLFINILLDADGTYYIDSAMAVVGSQPVDYVPKLPSVELEDCQRYYEKSARLDAFPNFGSEVGAKVFHSVGTDGIFGALTFMTRKRTPVSVTIYSMTGTANAVQDVISGTDVTGVTASNVSETGFERIDKVAGFVDNHGYRFHYIADAEI